jgi:glutamate racemase
LDKSQPIGVFDSGVGGLSVVKVLFSELPQEKIVYFGDTARVPYGSCTPQEIIRFGDEIITFLMHFQVKAVVAACNTSSSVSLPYLRQKFPIPIIGVLEPGARAAAAATTNRRVGVIATAATISSGAYPSAIAKVDPTIQVFTQPTPELVHVVEGGKIDDPETVDLLRDYLKPLAAAGIDTMVLGCTHYPFLAPIISKVLGPAVQLVDPAQQTVNELKMLLRARGPQKPVTEAPQHLFYTSGSTDSFYHTGRQFLNGIQMDVKQTSLKKPSGV